MWSIDGTLIDPAFRVQGGPASNIKEGIFFSAKNSIIGWSPTKDVQCHTLTAILRGTCIYYSVKDEVVNGCGLRSTCPVLVISLPFFYQQNI